jgi:hypothetical protein
LPDGHPNKYQYEIIEGEIKRYILEHSNVRASHSTYYDPKSNVDTKYIGTALRARPFEYWTAIQP